MVTVLQCQPLVDLRVLAAAQACAHARHEFLGLEGLRHIVVRAGFEPRHHVCGIRACGQHHDRGVGDATNRPAHVEAVHAGKHDVEEDQVRVALLKLSRAPVTVGTKGDAKPSFPRTMPIISARATSSSTTRMHELIVKIVSRIGHGCRRFHRRHERFSLS